MEVLHGSFAWEFRMEVLCASFAWKFCVEVLHGSVASAAMGKAVSVTVSCRGGAGTTPRTQGRPPL